jgi:hypothetical protein
MLDWCPLVLVTRLAIKVQQASIVDGCPRHARADYALSAGEIKLLSCDLVMNR